MANFLYGNIEDAIKRAKDMQKSYERNLVGKSILYLYLDNNTIKSLNVVFEEKNYLHLTGLDYNHIREGNLINGTKNPTQAINFYKLLKSDTPISQMKKNISFITLPNQSDNQNMFENTQKKLENLSNLVLIAMTAQKIGKPEHRKNSNVAPDFFIAYKKLMLALKAEDQHFFPLSSMKEEAEVVIKKPSDVLAIFQKDYNEHKYCLHFLNSKGVSKIDKAMFEPELTQKITLDSFVNEKKEFNLNALCNIRHNFIISSIKLDLSNISKMRQSVYVSETSLDEYNNLCNNFIEKLKIYNQNENDIGRRDISKAISSFYEKEVQKSKNTLVKNDDLIYDEIRDINKDVYSQYLDLKISLDGDDADFKRAATITADIKSPAAGLKNKTTNFSIEPQRGQKVFDVARPMYTGQAAGAIALPFPSNLPPLFDISRVITALETLNEKITNAIHSFTDSFSLSHSPKQSAQEQPPQARTAHERKINNELPFPKQKPADERTEPVTTKQEKARKPEVKPSEKQSSWIGNLISSARSESDAHNKNHEPKAHDKDKSL